jgi:serine/threonine-protein kinase RsbW
VGTADVLGAVSAELAGAGYPPRDCFAVRLALEEAVVNALKHGHGYDPSKEVRVRWAVTAEYLLAEVEDQGPGFDPADTADPRSPEYLGRPCGRGLLLIAHYMTAVRLNRRGNVIVLYKRRSAA